MTLKAALWLTGGAANGWRDTGVRGGIMKRNSGLYESELRFTVAEDTNWVVDLSGFGKLPEALIKTLVALDEGLRTDGGRLDATGLHMGHVGGREFPRLVALYGADTARGRLTGHGLSRAL